MYNITITYDNSNSTYYFNINEKENELIEEVSNDNREKVISIFKEADQSK